MFNIEKLETYVNSYKEEFSSQWKEENYKWLAIKHFQDNWDINAANFAEMFLEATAKVYNLLDSGYFYPRAMIKNFADSDQEFTRDMFINLFDESKDLEERVDKFISDSDFIRNEHGEEDWKNHFQTTNSISTYLWLKYPDKYYIYKYTDQLYTSKAIESSFKPGRGNKAEHLIAGYEFYDAIHHFLKSDDEITSLLNSKLTDDYYPDTNLITLTADLGRFISRKIQLAEIEEGWLPRDYDPNINKEEWIDLLNNKRVFNKSSLEIMKRMKDHGGMATCTQLSMKYGETKNFYNVGSSSLAQRVADETGCSKWITTDKERWWPILYVGKYASEETEGSFIWKLRDELSEALDEIDLSNIQLYANSTTWCISANLDKYNVVEAFDNLKKINWRQSTNISVGDIVYIYLAKPVQAIQYKCYVNAVDLESQEIDDREYYVDQEFYLDHGRFMELELLDSFTTSAYELEYLEKQDFSISQGPFRIKPKTNSYLNLLEKLKSIEEMDPDKHDGSYELVRETVRSYASLTDLSIVDYHDLNLVYLMSIGTWRHGIDSKRRSIEQSHLPEEEQERLNLLLTEVWEKAKNNEYENCENKETNIGMFGTGFYSFKVKTDIDSPRNFIEMCIDILDLDEDKEIFDRCQTVLTKDFSGMGAASASVVLHCLKPFTFPIFNSNMGASNIFAYLGVPLTQIGQIDTYIDNCRQVKKFRDDNFSIKNYRIFDRVAWELDSEEKHTSIDYLGVLDYLENNHQVAYSNPDKDGIAKEERQRLLEIKAKAQMAIAEMKSMAALCEERFDLDVLVPMSWLDGSNTKTRTYLWAQMKKSEHENNPISVSIFVEFPEETKKARYRYCLEIRNDGADKEMLEQYHRHLDIPINYSSNFVYVSGSNEYGVPSQITTDVEYIKERIADGTYEKVQPSYIVEQTHDLTNDDIEKEMLRAMEELVSVYDYVLDDSASEEIENKEIMKWDNKNLILYGPPGTGKTYNSARYAVAIVEEKDISEIEKEDYDAVFSRYKKYINDGLIAFTTFHQSFSYEEFIEGIRPVVLAEDEVESTREIEYEINDGIFKSFCDKAATPIRDGENTDLGIGKNPTVWKVSLGGTGDNPARTECLGNGHIRIGWDGYGEYITDTTDYSKYGGRAVLNAFYNRMQIGDIIMSCYSSKTIDAVGVVTGEPEWHDEYSHYKRLRKVNWLVKDMDVDIVDFNAGKLMTASTIYKLSVTMSDVWDILGQENDSLSIVNMKIPNRVFIIDEINRGNISKIFGELITLIEPSKRLNAKEESRATLPYSKIRFGVPDNVYIIGTMNTADRSIAMIDTALRRRFSFIEMQAEPELLENVVVEGMIDGVIKKVDIAQMLDTINKRITVLLDREHTIGHSYLLPLKDDPSLEKLSEIFENKIVPLLQEFFYDDYEKIQLVLGDNQKQDPLNKFIVRKEDIGSLFGTIDINYSEFYEINKEAFTRIDAYEYF